MAEIEEEVGPSQTKHDRMAPQGGKGADRVRAPPAKRTAIFFGQRFRHDEKAIEPIQQSQAARHQERHTQSYIAQQSAEGRPSHKADSEGRADEPETGGP